VELGASVYRWPRTVTFAGWRRRLPPGPRLSVGAPRGLTHVLRATAPVVHVRLHGPDRDHLHAGSHPDEDLRW
jgi:uncharacterized protein YecE (DUF72 family)